jgi:hypothetical protein
MILRFKKSYNNFVIRITVDTVLDEFYLEDSLTVSFIRLPLSKVTCLHNLLKHLVYNGKGFKFSLHNMLCERYMVMPRGSGSFLRERLDNLIEMVENHSGFEIDYNSLEKYNTEQLDAIMELIPNGIEIKDGKKIVSLYSLD